MLVKLTTARLWNKGLTVPYFVSCETKGSNETIFAYQQNLILFFTSIIFILFFQDTSSKMVRLFLHSHLPSDPYLSSCPSLEPEMDRNLDMDQSWTVQMNIVHPSTTTNHKTALPNEAGQWAMEASIPITGKDGPLVAYHLTMCMVTVLNTTANLQGPARMMRRVVTTVASMMILQRERHPVADKRVVKIMVAILKVTIMTMEIPFKMGAIILLASLKREEMNMEETLAITSTVLVMILEATDMDLVVMMVTIISMEVEKETLTQTTTFTVPAIPILVGSKGGKEGLALILSLVLATVEVLVMSTLMDLMGFTNA